MSKDNINQIDLTIGSFKTVEHSENLAHVHGELLIRIGNRPVPYLGFWGPDDVCFNNWFEELTNIVNTFEKREETTYIFDEGEQGQPAFKFEIDDEQMVHFSIIDALFSGGVGDQNWQNVIFSYQQFRVEIEKIFSKFIAVISKEAPEQIENWQKLMKIKRPTTQA